MYCRYCASFSGNDVIVINTVKNGSNTDLLGNGTCSKRAGDATSTGGVTCVIGNLAAAAGYTVKVGATVAPALACGAGPCPVTSFTLNGSVASAEQPSVNNPATSSVTSNVLPSAEIVVSGYSAAGNLSGATKFVVRRSLETLGTDFSDPPRNWLIHQKWKRDGVCPIHRTPLRHATVAGRTTVWCPRCQR